MSESQPQPQSQPSAHSGLHSHGSLSPSTSAAPSQEQQPPRMPTPSPSASASAAAPSSPPSTPIPLSPLLAMPSTVLATFPAPATLTREQMSAPNLTAPKLAPSSPSPNTSNPTSTSARSDSRKGGGFISRLFSRERSPRVASEKALEEQKQPSPSPSSSSSSSSPPPFPVAPTALAHSASSPALANSSRGKKSSTVVPTNGGLVTVAPQPQQPAASSLSSSTAAVAILVSPQPPVAVELKDGKEEARSAGQLRCASAAASLPGDATVSSSSPAAPMKPRLVGVQAHPSHGASLPPLTSPPALPSSSSSLPSSLGSSTASSVSSSPRFAVSVDPALTLESSMRAVSPALLATVTSPKSSSTPGLTAPRSSSGSHHRTSIAQYIDAERRHAQEQQYQLHKKRQHQLHTAGVASLQSLSVVYLPRGGIYVHTPAGPVQFGMPPETIKDSMRLGLTLPAYFIVPKERFNLLAGINVAEFEFPAYYNFFFKRRRINLIVTKQVEPLIRTIFRETLLGPSQVEWPAEYGESVPKRSYPDLMKEMSYFSVNPFDRSPLTVDSLLAFTHFDESGQVHLEHGVSIADEGEEYVVTAKVKTEGSDQTVIKEIARVRQEVYSTPVLDEPPTAQSNPPTQSQQQQLQPSAASPPSTSPVPPSPSSASSTSLSSPSSSSSPSDLPTESYFVPPHFGLTMLGNSDGFDSGGTTTGFVLWMNRRGIMVDPPPHSGALLKRHGISARLMRGVILTHCHADHDAGTFQKILEEGKVVLMTTEVILDSFLRKYSAISGLDASFLRKLFVFRPVLVGQRTAVYGGHVQFFYALHSIPCVGFSAYCNGKSMVYSADSFNDPAGIQRLYEQGYVSEGRRDALLHFPWHHDLILHEAGVPPIHTPLSTLEALPDDVKQRLYIVHKPSKDVPTDKGLRSALCGPQHTLVINSQPPANATALEVLDLLSSIDMFSGFDLSRALEILQCATFLSFQRGDTLIAEGSYGSTLYVVAMGTVCVSQDGEVIKHLTVGDHFGEMSIVTGEKRTASIRALTPVEVIQFSKQEFMYIVRHTDCIQRLQQLGVIQRSPSWQVMQLNSSLSQLSSAQKTYLQSLFIHRVVKAGETLWQAGEAATEAVLIADGQYHFSRAKEQAPFTRGALVGEMKALLAQSLLTTTLLCSLEGSVYAITRSHLAKFLDDNPGVRIRWMHRRFVE